MSAEYKCCFNGCGKTSTVSGDRCRHGKAQVEMRLIIDVGCLYFVDLREKIKSSKITGES